MNEGRIFLQGRWWPLQPESIPALESAIAAPWEQDVVDVFTVRGQIGVRAARVRHQQAWIGHELLTVDQILEDALPRFTEVNVVVRELRVLR